MSRSQVRARLRAAALVALPAVFVGIAAVPAAHAATTEPIEVAVTLGPGQSHTVGHVVSAPPSIVTPAVQCDPGVSVTFDADLVETVQVAPATPAGTFGCTVDFQVSGQSVGLVEQITVFVPGLSVTDVTVVEPDAGSVPATFTVSLSVPAGAPAEAAPVSVHYGTVDGTATAPGDYAATSGTLTFPAGQTSASVTVPVAGDAVDEPDETFAVALTGAAGAAVSRNGVGTILDNDRNGVFTCRASAADVAGAEPTVANDPAAPCRADQQSLASSSLNAAGLVVVSLSGLDAATHQTPDPLPPSTPQAGDQASATGGVSAVTISVADLVTITVNQASARATAQCVTTPGGLAPAFTGSSTVTGLAIDGVAVTVGSGPMDIPLVVGTLHVNDTVTTGTSVTQRAVWLQTALTDVVVGQATAGVRGSAAHPAGNPCVTR